MSAQTAALLARALVAQRMFNCELLHRLVAEGSLRQESAVAIAAKTAELVRDMPSDPATDQFAEVLARGFEEIAAALAGLPPIRNSS